MPVEFLTEEQQLSYGRYAGNPTSAQLERYFYLDDREKKLVNQRRGNHNRLGFALQLCTVRFLGTFLANPIDVPELVVSYLAKQLEIKETDDLSRYLEREPTKREHAGCIQELYGYQDFNAQPEHWRLVRWLYERIWHSAERPSLLFDLTTARLVQRKILLPGVTTLTRLIATIRERANLRLWSMLAKLPTEKQRQNLEQLLVVPENAHQSEFERMRKSPTRLSAPSLVKALSRLEQIRTLVIRQLNLSKIPTIRLHLLARYGMTSKAQILERMPMTRKIATLIAFAYILEEVATDDAIDLLDLLIRELLIKSQKEGKKERLKSLKDLDQAAFKLSEATAVLLDEEITDEEVRKIIFAQFDPQILAEAITTVQQLAKRDSNEYYYELMLARWRHIRLFLPKLLQTISFGATEAGMPVVEALDFLKSLEGSSSMKLKKIYEQVIPSKTWWRLIGEAPSTFNRRAYTFCVLEQLRIRLRRRDVFVAPSRRWNDPRTQLLQGDAWKSAKSHVCRLLEREKTFNGELGRLRTQLNQAYLTTASNFSKNGAVRLQVVDGQEKLVLTGLDKLDEPDSLRQLRSSVKNLLPRVDLPEVLLEVHQKTGFASAFTHLSEQKARVKDLEISICAVLLSEACNIDLEPLTRADLPALTADRLSWVKQNYLRQETIIEANAYLVNTQANINLAQCWGGGEVASADGLRFRVPVSTLNATPNSKYFGVGKGITYYNFTSDQFTGFHSIVIPGTLRDSLFLLEGLLEQQTSLHPTEIMTDTAGYSDVVFGLFWLLGYQFSPRLADIGEARFWRIDSEENYGVLNGLAKNTINIKLINSNWSDLLRIAGSLKLGTVSASDLMKTLQGGKNQSTLSKAIAEVGRIAKTLYLLNYIDDEAYRRRILTQLNRGEGRHKLARAVFHGKRGEIYQKYREGQEDQLSTLGLVVNATVLWNTYYMQEALSYLKGTGMEVKDEDIARLSPLLHKHINMLGRYHFSLPLELQQGQMRKLRVKD